MQESSLHIVKIDAGSEMRRAASLCASATITINCRRDALSLRQRISNMISILGRKFFTAGCENTLFLSADGLNTLWPLRGLLTGQSLCRREQLLLAPASGPNHEITIKESHSHVHKSLSSW